MPVIWHEAEEPNLDAVGYAMLGNRVPAECVVALLNKDPLGGDYAVA